MSSQHPLLLSFQLSAGASFLFFCLSGCVIGTNFLLQFSAWTVCIRLLQFGEAAWKRWAWRQRDKVFAGKALHVSHVLAAFTALPLIYFTAYLTNGNAERKLAVCAGNLSFAVVYWQKCGKNVFLCDHLATRLLVFNITFIQSSTTPQMRFKVDKCSSWFRWYCLPLVHSLTNSVDLPDLN